MSERNRNSRELQVCKQTQEYTKKFAGLKSLGVNDLWPSSAKRKRSGLGSRVRLRFPSSPLPSFSTLARSIRQKSIATSSSSGRKRCTGALIITSLLSSRRSARHSSPFLWREHSERGIEVTRGPEWVGKKTVTLFHSFCFFFVVALWRCCGRFWFSLSPFFFSTNSRIFQETQTHSIRIIRTMLQSHFRSFKRSWIPSPTGNKWAALWWLEWLHAHRRTRFSHLKKYYIHKKTFSWDMSYF